MLEKLFSFDTSGSLANITQSTLAGTKNYLHDTVWENTICMVLCKFKLELHNVMAAARQPCLPALRYFPSTFYHIITDTQKCRK